MGLPLSMFSTNFVVKQNIFLCCRKKLAFREMITVEPPLAKYAYSYNGYLFITLQCYFASIFHVLTYTGCNVLCCRVFRQRVRCARSLSCSQFCRGVGWTLLPLKLPLLSYLDGLKPYYCNKFSFETFDVISVWLHSVINPRVLCVLALPIQGRHLWTEIWSFVVGSLQDGIRAHADCRTRPLG